MARAKIEGAQAFIRGDSFCKHNIITDGNTIWSYGKHFPMASKIQDGAIAVSIERYSMTTSHHQGTLRGELAKAGYEPSDVVWFIGDNEARVWNRR
jgi:hypothetical protein